jgi:hypothetical protein
LAGGGLPELLQIVRRQTYEQAARSLRIEENVL